jgi:alanine racemase
MTDFPPGRPTACFIDHGALRENFRQIQNKVGSRVKVLSMVKANAYGHGAPAVARTLAAQGSSAFGVATVREGIELREVGIRQPVLIVAGTYPEDAELLLKFELTPVLHDILTLQSLEQAIATAGRALDIHVEVDTGMGRTGLPAAELDSWLPEITRLRSLRIAGVFSHFSDAEAAHEPYTENQLRCFASVIERIRGAGIGASLLHMAKSAALITVQGSHFDLVRPGLSLYGIYPAPELQAEITLKPVLSWKTRILQLKRVPQGASLGYGRTFTTRRESVIGTLPVGYADGYHRLLSNRAFVLVAGKRAPIAGRISMDLTTVDLTDIDGIKQGEEVVLLGSQADATISADEMASWAETISYEILTSIGARVPRIHQNS